MKRKFIFGILTLDFLILSSSLGFGYVSIVGPNNLKLDSIQQGTGGSSSSISNILIIEANQDVQITFSTAGNLKREELDRTGSGLRRYDALEITMLNLRIRGNNVFERSGNINDFDGLITPTIIPDGNEKIWMDISIQAERTGPNYGKDNVWWESDDAGLYLSSVTMTVVPVGQPPRPSLEFRPDDAQGTSPSFCIVIYNTGDDEKDDAENVEVSIIVIKGLGYVSSVSYNPGVGDVENEQGKNFCFTIVTNSAWDSAPSGSEVKLKIEVTREDNWSSYNVGKKTHYTLVK